MENKKYFLLVTMTLHLLALIGLIILPFEVEDIYLFIAGYILIGGLGVNIGLHRWASHRSVQLNTIAKPIVLFFSTMACQGNPLWWAAIHRRHHRFSDQEKDHHSPVVQNKWFAFFGWLIEHEHKNVEYKYSGDLIRDKMVVWFSNHCLTITWGTWFVLLVINPTVLLWFIVLPAIVALHSEGLVNAFCHGTSGYRNFETKDQSRNVSLLGWLNWGNGWHNNHHSNPSSFDFGRGISGKWWELDPCTLILPLIRK